MIERYRPRELARQDTWAYSEEVEPEVLPARVREPSERGTSGLSRAAEKRNAVLLGLAIGFGVPLAMGFPIVFNPMFLPIGIVGILIALFVGK